MNKPSDNSPTQCGGSALPNRVLKTQAGDVEILLPKLNNIPTALRELPFAYWIAEPKLDDDGKQECKTNGKPRIGKAPRNSRGYNISKLKPEQWTSFDECARNFDPNKFHGIGPLIQAQSGIVGIDLDDYDDMKVVTPKIEDIIRRVEQAGIYCELSPSQTGLRLFVKGSLPEGKGRRQNGIELYADTAFLTLTGAPCWLGDVVEGQWLVDELLALIENRPGQTGAEKADTRDNAASTADPAMVNRLVSEMAKQQPGLWQGLWQQDEGNLHKEYKSQSEADFALCGHILRAAVAAGVPPDALATTITEVFLRSGLYRPEKEGTLRKSTIPNIIKHNLETDTTAPAASTGSDEKDLKPLPSPLPPSPTFDLDLLPQSLRGVVEDVSARMQIPAEIVATPLLISLGSVIGKKLAIQPRSHDPSWYEYPNFWGAAILPPGMLKSPILKEAIRFIRELDEEARIRHAAAMLQWKADEALNSIVKKDRMREIIKLHKQNKVDEARDLAKSLQGEPPVRKRYLINDATPEARLRILGENPNGVMLIRDELSGHIAQLHKDGFEQSRAQELQFYDGKFNYEDDRLKREGMFASDPRMALYGNLQPSKVEALLYDRSVSAKGSDDGYLERLFQLAVMPSISTEYTINEKQPDEAAEARVRAVFRAADALPMQIDGSGRINPVKVEFDLGVGQLFAMEFAKLERTLRKPEGNGHLGGHIGKFRGTIPKLALILAFCDDPELTAISRQALLRAIKLTKYYLKHAARIYALGEPSDVASAHELLGHIQAGQVRDGFAPRDVEMRKWKRLKTLGDIEGAIAVLCEHSFLRESRSVNTGGAPGRKFLINPAVQVRGQAA